MGLLRRLLLRKGRLPAELRSRLDAERIVLLAEGVPARLSRAGGRATPTVAAVALTQQSLVIAAGGDPLVDVTWDGGEARALELTVQERVLRVGFGDDELELVVGDAAQLADAIEQRRRELPRRTRLADRD